ncbi:MAG TPA: hypothetical protein PLH72_00135 [Vicinamibacterales bacterium]|nr:hypothetical protein [Vicinamibacterales bacterium]
MSTEHDLEYGPTPPGAQYEHTDVDPAIGYSFGIWLAIAMLLSGGIVFGTFWLFEGRQVAADVQQFPLADGQDEVPPSPRLQTQPFKDGYLLKERQDERLDSYGWTDKASGAVHIPIDRAIDLTLERGLPARQGEGEARPMVAQDSSSGRTSAPR